MFQALYSAIFLGILATACGSQPAETSLAEEPAVKVGATEETYEAASARAEKESKPLLVLVGAPWCASCQVMKRETIEPMKSGGELDNVVVVFVDKDAKPELAEQLMRGTTLPQVVMFKQDSEGWKRFSLTGMQSVSRLRELLNKAKDIQKDSAAQVSQK